MSILLKPVEDHDGVVRSWGFMCPGCRCTHDVRVEKHPEAPDLHTWTWNGSVERPTFHPSIVTWWDVNVGTPEEIREHWRRRAADRSYVVPQREHRCHSWVVDGVIDFLADSTHELRDKHPIPPHPRVQQPQS